MAPLVKQSKFLQMLHHFFYIFEKYIYPSEISLYYSEISQAIKGINSPLGRWASPIFLCLLDCVLNIAIKVT